MSDKEEKLAKLRSRLTMCREHPIVSAGSTDADFQFRERVNAAINLFLAWLDFELAKE